MAADCFLRETNLRGLRAVTLGNGLLSVTLLPEKGADIYSLVCARTGVDLLWKAPWGLRRAPAETEAQWLDQYSGGWQVLIPNAGDSCLYRGALLPFHGEACLREWDYTVRRSDAGCIQVEFSTELCRSPFLLRRTVTLERGRAAMLIEEYVENRSPLAMHYMWGHHPAFGAPFLEGGCRLRVPARRFLAHDAEISPACRLAPAVSGQWPLLPGKDGRPMDLSVLPPSAERISEFGYLPELDAGWYAIENPRLGLAFGLAWEPAVFPHLWLWQEFGGCLDAPWYGRCYVMALEPFNSMPGTGLVNAIKSGCAPALPAGGTIRTRLAAALFAPRPLAHITLDGQPI